MPFRYPPQVRDQILERLAAGAWLKDIEREPGMPCQASVSGWMRRDPAFATAVAEARAQGRWRRQVWFDETRAWALVARLAAGERIGDIVRDPAMPGYRTFTRWRRADPAFAEDVHRLMRGKVAEKSARMRGRYRPFDPVVADRLYVRLWQGEAVRAVLRSDRAFPSRAVLARWRREQPEFDARLRSVFAGWKRRDRRRDLCTPALMETIRAGVLAGGSLRSLARRADTPCAMTLYKWMRTRPAFAAMVAQASGDRDDLLSDQILAAADAATPATLADAKREVARLLARLGRLGRRPGDG